MPLPFKTPLKFVTLTLRLVTIPCYLSQALVIHAQNSRSLIFYPIIAKPSAGQEPARLQTLRMKT